MYERSQYMVNEVHKIKLLKISEIMLMMVTLFAVLYITDDRLIINRIPELFFFAPLR